jgi:hypothetical protein
MDNITNIYLVSHVILLSTFATRKLEYLEKIAKFSTLIFSLIVGLLWLRYFINTKIGVTEIIILGTYFIFLIRLYFNPKNISNVFALFILSLGLFLKIEHIHSIFFFLLWETAYKLYLDSEIKMHYLQEIHLLILRLIMFCMMYLFGSSTNKNLLLGVGAALTLLYYMRIFVRIYKIGPINLKQIFCPTVITFISIWINSEFFQYFILD